MAQLVAGAVGAVVGWFAGGPSGAVQGFMAGASLYSMANPAEIEGPRLGDLRLQGTEYGQPIPWVAGSPRVAGQIVWASALKEHANTEGGKGGGPEVTTYTYSVDLMIMLTENEIAGISRIWKNGELVWNGTTTKDGVWGGLTIYTGAADQLPDPIYEAAVGVGNAPAYRGRGYVVIQDLNLGGSKYIPNLTFEVGSGAEWTTVAGPESILVSAFTLRNNTNPSYHLARDIAHTEISTWESYFGEYGSAAALYVDYYTNADAPGGTDVGSPVLSPKTLPIDTGIGYVLYAGNRFWLGDICDANFEFLNASGGVVFAMALVDAGAAEFQHYLKHGASLGALGSGSQNLNTLGTLTFASGLVTFTNTGGSEGNSGFTFACDALSIASVRVSGIVVKSTYTGSVVDPAAYVYFQKAPHTVDVLLPSVSTPLDLDLTLDRLMARAGYLSSQYDITETSSIDKQVRALALSQVASTRSALELLQQAFFYECSASDKIYIRPRATTSLVTIPFADLGCSDNAVSDVEPLALKMANDLELPAQIALSYPNMAGDYNTDTQFSDRLLSGQESTSTIQMALGMTPGEAKGVVDALLFDAVAGRVSTTISLPLKYAYLEPGDVVTVTNFDGRTYRLRVMVRRDLMIRLELDCVLDDVQALDSAAITDTGYISTADVVQVANTLWDALDMPLLRDADNGPGYYVAVTSAYVSATDEWPGAVVARAWNTTDYEQLYSTPDACVMGACGTTLGNWTGGNVFDEANTLTVTVRGQLASSTRDAMLGDLTINSMLVGSEVIRFRLAALVSSDADTGQYTYLLSGLLRGQRGTEWAMAGHVSSEACVLLNGKLRHVASQTNQIGMSCNVKAVTAGKLLSSATPEVFIDTGVALKPFSPANPRALTGTDVVVTWQRRTRLSYRLVGSSPTVPLGEASESYRVRIYDGATLVRTATVSTPTYTYAAADITADGFASSDPISFEICQMSETVGAGYPATVTGTAP